MVDRTLLPESMLEYVVLADTHAMLPGSQAAQEMESRNFQTARSDRALQLVASLNPDFAVHMGDVVQESPENPEFASSVDRALAAIRERKIEIHHVAGNHDIGDKPDPTMPTSWVTAESLATWEQQLGQCSWQSWDSHGWHFVVLNSQIMNSGLPAEADQQAWVEADLDASSGRPTTLFLHLSPYLVHESEPSLGHYDNIAGLARSWLLDLIERHHIHYVFSGHSHFQFFNRWHGARLYVTPSTSFTRPGFSEIFASEAPPEQGRNDTAKLGFFLVRVQPDERESIHFVRSQTPSPVDLTERDQLVLTRLPHEFPQPRLGLIGRHPLAPTGEVPVAWPSAGRQPMRNDYPLLSLIEIGAGWFTVPSSDLSDPIQAGRLAYLQDEGVRVQATWLWSAGCSEPDIPGSHLEQIDAIEFRGINELLPSDRLMDTLGRLQHDYGVAVCFAPFMARDVVPRKQLARSRLGYRLDELVALDDHLGRQGIRLTNVAVRVDPWNQPFNVMTAARAYLPLANVEQIDWLVESHALDPREHLESVTEAMLGASLFPGSRLFLDPFIDFDRTMDIATGLLDRQCNPRPAFQGVRILNSVLFGGFIPTDQPPEAWSEPTGKGRSIILAGDSFCIEAEMPDARSGQSVSLVLRQEHADGKSETFTWDLYRGVRLIDTNG